MLKRGPAKKVTIYINEDAQHHAAPLHDAILTFLLNRGVSGATSMRACAGFGSSHMLHTPKIEVLAQHLPLRIEFIESPEKVEEVLPTLHEMVADGLIEVQDTFVVKAARRGPKPEPKLPHQKKQGPAKLLRVFLGEADHWHGEPLYDAIVKKLRMLEIAGATVFRGLEGYGETAALHRHHLARADEPILIAVVDTAEAIERLIAEIEPMIDTGLIAVSPVEVIRVQKRTDAGGRDQK